MLIRLHDRRGRADVIDKKSCVFWYEKHFISRGGSSVQQCDAGRTMRHGRGMRVRSCQKVAVQLRGQNTRPNGCATTVEALKSRGRVEVSAFFVCWAAFRNVVSFVSEPVQDDLIGRTENSSSLIMPRFHRTLKREKRSNPTPQTIPHTLPISPLLLSSQARFPGLRTSRNHGLRKQNQAECSRHAGGPASRRGILQQVREGTICW